MRDLEQHVLRVWQEFKHLYPELPNKPPDVVLSTRLKTTSGKCWQRVRVIALNASLYATNKPYMLRTILVHELAHQVDHDIYGDVRGSDFHRASWADIMLAYGLTPNHHSDL